MIGGVFLFSDKNKIYEKEGFYFDTYVSVKVYSSKDEKYLNECMNICERYENLLSRTLKGSDVYNINNANGENVKVDKETFYLIKRSLEFCEETDGAVDITIAPLIDEWGFSDRTYSKNAKPEDKRIKELLSDIDYKCVVLTEPDTVRLTDPKAKIDLGFIAKGYIADKIKEYLVSNGVESGIISLGGNIVVINAKPDGSDYNVGIKDPSNSGDIISSVKVKNKSVVTSGTYERFVEYDGIKYHHILDTSTGYPVDNGIESVTIISDSSLEGDALSTICLILGEEGSKELLDKYNAEASYIK